jgi:hypothetical protein
MMSMIKFELVFTEHAHQQMDAFEKNSDKTTVCKAVHKILGFMETDLRHPSLHTHKYDGMAEPNKDDVFESYAQNRTPGAYRIFWHYGPGKGEITILDVSHHP